MNKRVGRRELILLALTLLGAVTLLLMLVSTCRLLVARNFRPVRRDVSCTSIAPWAETIRTRLVSEWCGPAAGRYHFSNNNNNLGS